MKLQRLLLITAGIWFVAVIALGYWQLFYAWHVGSGLIFFFHTLPLSLLTLILLAALEAFYWRWRH